MKILSYIKRLYYLIDLILFYIYDLFLSGFKIGLDVVTVKNLSNPRFIKCSVESKSDLELTVLANLISFSPGTMIVDVDVEKRIFVIHVMFNDTDEGIINSVRDKLERRVLRVLRERR